MKALTIDQAMKIGSEPTDREIRALIGELTEEIDASLLVPMDLRFLMAVLAFNTEKDRSWRLDVKCPYCGDARTLGLTRKDFPTVTVLDKDAPYPLTIFDGTHTWTLGYATVESMERYEKRDPEHKDIIELIAQYILKVDEEADPDRIREILGATTDFSLIALMLKTADKYFAIKDTYKEYECPKCKKVYRIPLSALEVTQYTPFLDTETFGKYQTNFRL